MRKDKSIQGLVGFLGRLELDFALRQSFVWEVVREDDRSEFEGSNNDFVENWYLIRIQSLARTHYLP